MLIKVSDFASAQGLTLSGKSLAQLDLFAQLVWEKKDFLNLTSVADKAEIYTRHLCDGLAAAGFFAHQAPKEQDSFSIADMGAGAGYIGLSIAIALPQARVTLVESLEKRCSFMNWVALKLGLSNTTVQCLRLGQKEVGPFDFVTERAMGQINDILPLIAPCISQGGVFAAYQSRPDEADKNILDKLSLTQVNPVKYRLPQEEKERYLAVFKY